MTSQTLEFANLHKMNKKQIQQRVLQDGKPLDLEKFEWNKETRTFSTNQDNLVLNFTGVNNCTFDTGSGCTFKTSYNCTFDTGSDCTFNTLDNCTFKTLDNCTFKTLDNCTFKTGSYCTFDTSYNCTFNTLGSCTFDTGSDCTFDTGSGCTFKTENGCVIVNRNVFEVIATNRGDVIQIAPSGVKGHIKNGIYSETGKEAIIADGIMSHILSKKGNVYKVINHGKSEISYLFEIERDNKKIYSHGKTIKEAKESLIYKLADRDKSKYKDLELDSILTRDEAITCYMTITGACSAGTKYFIDNLDEVKKEYSIKEIIDITKDQFGNDLFKKFFKK